MGKTAFIFPGQGSQSVGMCMDLYERSDKVKNTFKQAETVCPGITELIQSGLKEQLDITINTQPALFLADLACAEILAENGITAQGIAGFSLGEVPGACYAGLMDFKQAFDFVCFRAMTMQECAETHPGAMFALLKLTAGQVEEICSSLNAAYPVNYNCPGQTVVACATDTAIKLEKAVFDAGGKALKLAVSGAFHSPFMDSASRALAKYLEGAQIGEMQVPLYANMTAKVYDNPKELLSKQVNHPVLWQKTIESMIDDGFDTFIEAGPGKTLSGLVKKITADMQQHIRIFNVSDIKSLENTLREIKERHE